MKVHVRQFSNPGDLVLDAVVGKLSTVKVCFQLDKHRQFVACEKDGGCLKKSPSGFMEVHASPVLRDKNDLKS